MQHLWNYPTAPSTKAGSKQKGDRKAPILVYTIVLSQCLHNVRVILQLTQSNSKSLLQNSLRFVELVDLIKVTLVLGPVWLES